MCRLREAAAAHVVLTLYYHLFNGTDGSVAENVHSVTIHQGRNQTPQICPPPSEAGLTPRSILLCADSSLHARALHPRHNFRQPLHDLMLFFLYIRQDGENSYNPDRKLSKGI